MNRDGRSADLPDPAWLDGPLPPEAPAELAATYGEIAAHLRVPFLGPFWRALAWDAETFRRIWAAVAPVMRTRAFEREAAALRDRALIVEAVTMPSHQAFKGDLVRSEIDFEMRGRIANYNAAVHYALPKTLLVATWLLNPPVAAADAAAAGEIPVGIAPGAVAVPPAPPEQVRARLAELLDEIPRAHGHAITDEYFRAIGRLTDYLNAAWNAIKPVVRDEPYDERARELIRLAEAALARLPARPADLAGFPDGSEEAERLRRALAYYAQRHLPDLLLDVAMIKGLTDGPERAQESPFAIT
jgi:hypothetical protein